MAAQGVSVTVADARFAKSLGRALIRQLLRHHKALATVEQAARRGSGALLPHGLANDGSPDGRCEVRTMTQPDRFIDQSAPGVTDADAGSNAVYFAATATQAAGLAMRRVGA